MDPRYPPIEFPASTPYNGTELEVQPTEVPLGLVLLRNLWTSTKGTLTLDLKRPGVQRQAASRSSLFTFRKQEAERSAPPTRPGGAHFTSRPMPRADVGQPLRVVAFSDTGARLKLMRHVQLGEEFEGVSSTGAKKRYPAMDIGVGFNFELDTAELQPQARIKLWDLLSLRLLPNPSLKISKRLALQRGNNGSGWGVRLSYDCPLEHLDHFWEPGAARLMVSVDNLASNGLRLTQTGVEFNGRFSLADGSLSIRGQGHVEFPQQLPVEEGEPLVRYELRRLGLKAIW